MKYALPAAWLLTFVYRLTFGASAFSLWLLRFLTVVILLAIGLSVARFVADRVRAMKRGDRVFTEATLRGLLLSTAVLGLVIRLIAWDPGNEGVLAWIGGVVLVVSILGLVTLQFLKERAARSKKGESFYFNPYWKYGLLFMCLATLAIQGAARPEGAPSTLNISLFWIALIALVVQGIGRLILRRRPQNPRTSPGPTA